MLNSVYAVHKKVANTNKVLGIFKEGGRGDEGGGGLRDRRKKCRAEYAWYMPQC